VIDVDAIIAFVLGAVITLVGVYSGFYLSGKKKQDKPLGVLAEARISNTKATTVEVLKPPDHWDNILTYDGRRKPESNGRK